MNEVLISQHSNTKDPTGHLEQPWTLMTSRSVRSARENKADLGIMGM
jgi:hypothetical protein